MTDQGSSKKPEIPLWQRSETQKPLQDESGAISDATPRQQEPNHDSVLLAEKEPRYTLQNVQAFLEDPAVKNAPEDKRRAFLNAKGVPHELVDEMIAKTTSATDEKDTGTGSSKTDFDVQEFASSRTKTTSSITQSRDTPPIVTYPEFLVKPQKPPPLVTLGGLLNTAYIAGSAAAAFYGASKYLLQPMLTDMTHARHDFATHSHEQIRTLNDRLEKTVSKLPSHHHPPASLLTSARGDEYGESDSITSDPTELFHRDIGVQTSPSLSRRASSSSSSSSPSLPVSNPQLRSSPLDTQLTRLTSLHTTLDAALQTEISARDANTDLESAVIDLKGYLDSLIYAPPTHPDHGVWNPTVPNAGSAGHAGGGHGTASTAGRRKAGGSGSSGNERDGVTALRSEIRSVKGLLLSARQFPALSNGVGRSAA